MPRERGSSIPPAAGEQEKREARTRTTRRLQWPLQEGAGRRPKAKQTFRGRVHVQVLALWWFLSWILPPAAATLTTSTTPVPTTPQCVCFLAGYPQTIFVNGAAWTGVADCVSCPSEHGVLFDGVDDHLSLGSLTLGSTMTYMMWVWADAANNMARVFEFANGGWTNSHWVGFDGNSGIITLNTASGESHWGIADPNVFPLNQWVHVAATLNGGSAILYMDGVPVVSGAVHDRGTEVRSNCYIGRSIWSGDGYFQGRIADFRAYSVTLSAEEIVAESAGGPLGDRGPPTWYRVVSLSCSACPLFDFPQSSFVNGAALTGVWVDCPSCSSSHGVSFDGVDDHLSLGSLTLGSTMTYMMWVWADAANNMARVFEFANGGWTNSHWVGFDGNSGIITLNTASGESHWGIADPNVFPLNQWVHVAATLNGGSAILYMDGVPVVSGAVHDRGTEVRSNCYIGRSIWSGDGYFQGRIADFRAYSVTLSAEEIVAQSVGGSACYSLVASLSCSQPDSCTVATTCSTTSSSTTTLVPTTSSSSTTTVPTTSSSSTSPAPTTSSSTTTLIHTTSSSTTTPPTSTSSSSTPTSQLTSSSSSSTTSSKPTTSSSSPTTTPPSTTSSSTTTALAPATSSSTTTSTPVPTTSSSTTTTTTAPATSSSTTTTLAPTTPSSTTTTEAPTTSSSTTATLAPTTSSSTTSTTTVPTTSSSTTTSVAPTTSFSTTTTTTLVPTTSSLSTTTTPAPTTSSTTTTTLVPATSSSTTTSTPAPTTSSTTTTLAPTTSSSTTTSTPVPTTSSSRTTTTTAPATSSSTTTTLAPTTSSSTTTTEATTTSSSTTATLAPTTSSSTTTTIPVPTASSSTTTTVGPTTSSSTTTTTVAPTTSSSTTTTLAPTTWSSTTTSDVIFTTPVPILSVPTITPLGVPDAEGSFRGFVNLHVVGGGSYVGVTLDGTIPECQVGTSLSKELFVFLTESTAVSAISCGQVTSSEVVSLTLVVLQTPIVTVSLVFASLGTLTQDKIDALEVEIASKLNLDPRRIRYAGVVAQRRLLATTLSFEILTSGGDDASNVAIEVEEKAASIAAVAAAQLNSTDVPTIAAIVILDPAPAPTTTPQPVTSVLCPSKQQSKDVPLTGDTGTVNYLFPEGYAEGQCFWVVDAARLTATSVELQFTAWATEDKMSIFTCEHGLALCDTGGGGWLVFTNDSVARPVVVPTTAFMLVLEKSTTFSLAGFDLRYSVLESPLPSCAAETLLSEAGTVEFVWPTGYPNTMDCVWNLRPPTTSAPSMRLNALTIEFAAFDVEAGQDFLYVCGRTSVSCDGQDAVFAFSGVQSGTRSNSGMLERGATAPEAGVSYRLLTDLVKLRFVSDAGGFGRGFRLMFRSEYLSALCPEDAQRDSPKGNIVFLQEGGYAKEMDCAWEIVPAGATSLSLSFTAFSLQVGDFVFIFACRDTEDGEACTQHRQLSGQFPPADAITVSTGRARLQFVSDAIAEAGIGTGRGFNLSYVADFPKPPDAGDPGPETQYKECPSAQIRIENEGVVDFWHSISEYAPDRDAAPCVWILSPPKALGVALDFEHFELDSSDSLQLLQCRNTACEDGMAFVVSASGRLEVALSGSVPPPPAQADFGTVRLVFVSDGQAQKQGFRVSWTAIGVPAGNCPAAGSLDGVIEVAAGQEEAAIDFSGGYKDLESCEWTLRVETGRLEIEFSRFETESFDVLYVYECPDSTCQVRTLIQELSGLNQSLSQVVSKYSTVRLLFASDGQNTFDGFELKFRQCRSAACLQGVQCPSNADVVLREDAHEIRYDFAQEDYPPLRECSWIINTQLATAGAVRLHFPLFDVERLSDTVKVYACESKVTCDGALQHQIASYSGRSGSAAAPAGPDFFVAAGLENMLLRMVFTSDASGQGQGFVAAWQPFSYEELNMESARCDSLTFRAESDGGEVKYWPRQYPTDASCRWLLAPVEAAGVYFELLSLDLEPGFDYLEIRACDSLVGEDMLCDSGSVLETYTGAFRLRQADSEATKFRVARTPYMEVVFRSDSAVNGDGFQFKWRPLPDQAALDAADVWPGKCPNMTGAAACPTLDCCRNRATACVDSRCTPCPDGVVCYHGQFVSGRFNGERWGIDRDSRRYEVRECADGFEKHLPMSTTISGVPDYERMQCRPCGDNRYIALQDTQCQDCPIGSVCHCDFDAQNPGIVSCTFDKHKVRLDDQEVDSFGSWALNEKWGVYLLERCPAGTERIGFTSLELENLTSSEVTDRTRRQTCRRCEADFEYILDPNFEEDSGVILQHHDCKACPIGAMCNSGHFVRGAVPDSHWRKHVESSEYHLFSCPPGFQLMNTNAVSGAFDHALQYCRACGLDYVIRPNDNKCEPCPVGARCLNGQFLLDASPNVTWREIDTTGVYELVSCPPGSLLVKYREQLSRQPTFSPENQQCRTCVPDADAAGVFIFNPNVGYLDSDACMECPAGAECSGTHHITSRIANASWEAVEPTLTELLAMVDDGALPGDVETWEGVWRALPPRAHPNIDTVKKGFWYLRSCPAGYRLLNTTVDGFALHAQACELCPAGTQCTDVVCDSCTLCPTGFYKEDAGQPQPCLPCPAAHYNPFTGGSSQGACQPCPANSAHQLANASDMWQCTCFPKFYARADPATNGSMVCTVCPQFGACEAGVLQPRADIPSARFEPDARNFLRAAHCPTGFVRVRNSAHPERDNCVICPAGTYLLEPALVEQQQLATKECLDCPYGANCSGGASVVPIKGYWRNQESEGKVRRGKRRADEPPLQVEALVFRCPPGLCDGDNVCREGHEPGSPVCGVCMDGYTMTGSQECVSCGESESQRESQVTLAYVAIVCAAIVAFFSFPCRPIISAFVIPWLWQFKVVKAVLNVFQKKGGDDKGGEGVKRLQGIFKIAITASQVSSSFISNFSVNWPKVFYTVIGSLWWTRMDVLSMAGPACVAETWTYTELMLIKTVTPMGAALFAAIPLLMAWVFGWNKNDNPIRKPDPPGEDGQAPETPPTYYQIHREVKDQYWWTVIMIFFLLFPTVAVTALQGFHCQDLGRLDSKEWLAADYREVCPVDEPGGFIFQWTIVSTVLYPIGLPLALVLVLKTYRVPSLAKDKVNSAKLKALCDNIGMPNTISTKHCFFQNLITTFGTEKALMQKKIELSKGVRAYSSLKKMAVPKVAFEVQKRMCKQKLQELSQRICDAFIEGGSEEQSPTEPTSTIEGAEPGTDLVGLTTRLTERAGKCTQDDIMRLCNFLLDEDLLALPANGWSNDNEHDILEHSAAQRPERRSFRQFLVSTWKLLTGATDIEFFSDIEYQFYKTRALQRAGFLFETYEVAFWYFEIIEIQRKLIMTTLLKFLYPGTAAQLGSALVISLIFLVLNMKLQPFLDPELDFLQTSTMVAQHCTLLYGLLALMQQSLVDTGANDEAGVVGWLVTLLNLFVVIWPFVKYCMHPVSLFRKVRGMLVDAGVWGWFAHHAPKHPQEASLGRDDFNHALSTPSFRRLGSAFRRELGFPEARVPSAAFRPNARASFSESLFESFAGDCDPEAVTGAAKAARPAPSPDVSLQLSQSAGAVDPTVLSAGKVESTESAQIHEWLESVIQSERISAAQIMDLINRALETGLPLDSSVAPAELLCSPPRAIIPPHEFAGRPREVGSLREITVSLAEATMFFHPGSASASVDVTSAIGFSCMDTRDSPRTERVTPISTRDCCVNAQGDLVFATPMEKRSDLPDEVYIRI